jgi:quinoprotein glucose dehydrogenase
MVAESKAVVQLTKMAFAYRLRSHERNSVWPIDERPVPQSDVPGEKTSPTQRFPRKPPAFDRQGHERCDVIDFHAGSEEMALKAIEGFRLGPVFTPPSMVDRSTGAKGTLTFPRIRRAQIGRAARSILRPGFLYVASATRADTAVYGVVKPEPGQTDLSIVGTGSIARQFNNCRL